MKTQSSYTTFRMILTVMICIIGIKYFCEVIRWNKNVAKVPPVSIGHIAVFYDEMDESMRIDDIDSTEQYIYFAYSTPGVVAVYDWNGKYYCSYAFFRGTNGTLGMRCDDGMLYVHDYAGYEYVISGTENTAVYDMESRLHLLGWFHESYDKTVIVNNGNVYDLDGNHIMLLPGRI